MKSLIVPLAALAVLTAGTGAAMAAPPAYCALYAREYANQFAAAAGEKPGSEPKIQDEAYYRCLNMDQEPEMPATSAYYGSRSIPPAKLPRAGRWSRSPALLRQPPTQPQHRPPAPRPSARCCTGDADAAKQDGRQRVFRAFLYRRQTALDARMAGRLQEVFPQFLQREGRDHPAPRLQQAGVVQVGLWRLTTMPNRLPADREHGGRRPCRHTVHAASERASRRDVPRGEFAGCRLRGPTDE